MNAASKRKVLLPKTDIFHMIKQVGAVIPDNFPTDYELNEAIAKTKAYYMFLNQDETNMNDCSSSDESDENPSTDKNGTLLITPIANENN